MKNSVGAFIKYRSNPTPTKLLIGPKVQDEVTGLWEYGELCTANDFGEIVLADGYGMDQDRSFGYGQVIERTPKQEPPFNF